MSQQPQHRTYGNWRRPQSTGLGQLSLLATIVLFAGMIVTILISMIQGLLAALGVALIVGVIVMLFTVKDRDDLTIADRIGERVMFVRAKRRKTNLYRSGVAGKTEWGTVQLPGVLAQTKIGEFRDSFERQFAVIEIPSSGTFALAFVSEPDGESLVDQSMIDQWVANFGGWLAGLSGEAGLVGAQVIIETTPDSGTRLRQEIHANLHPNAPQLAKDMLSEVQVRYPGGSAAIRTYVTLTYKGSQSGVKKRSLDEFGRAMSSRIPALTGGLSGTGAGVIHPMQASELRRVVRTAYDPSSDALFDEAMLTGQTVDLPWSECGPTAADAQWDHYKHDSGESVTWMMTRAPAGSVQSSVLKQLLAPHESIVRKRVALMYRPVSMGRTAQIVEADLNAASSRANNMSRVSARAMTDVAKARKSSEEEASGAGVENFGLIITATALDDKDLPLVESTVEDLSAASRLRIRKAFGAQDAAFAAGLPVGIVPVLHSAVSPEVRAAL